MNVLRCWFRLFRLIRLHDTFFRRCQTQTVTGVSMRPDLEFARCI